VSHTCFNVRFLIARMARSSSLERLLTFPPFIHPTQTFRKEAIYRQMLEYKRLHKRSSARVAELERRKHALEAGLEGVEVCWSEVRHFHFMSPSSIRALG
jgi:hypothetical protein